MREIFQNQAGGIGLYILKEENKFQTRIFRSSFGRMAIAKRNDDKILKCIQKGWEFNRIISQYL